MTVASEQLRAELLSLPEKDRAELAEMLIESLGCPPGIYHEDDPAFLEELARREADMLSGKSVPIPAEEVFARIDAHLAALRR